MEQLLTPAARRTVESCRRISHGSRAPQEWCDFLMLGLLEIESLAAAALQRLGASADLLLSVRHSQRALSKATECLLAAGDIVVDQSWQHATTVVQLDDPLELVQILDRAASLSRRDAEYTGISSAHLLVAVFETNELLRGQLLAIGIDREQLVIELDLESASTGPSLPVDFDLNLTADPSPSNETMSLPRNALHTAMSDESSAVWRVIDANLNRCREGLRVLEDFARFARNDAKLSEELKTLRHELVAAESLLARQGVSANPDKPQPASSQLLSHRDTVEDVGTTITTLGETQRCDLAGVVLANCRRVQEALRSLEEFGKLVSPEFSAKIKQIRYRTYTLQQSLQAVHNSTTESSLREKRLRRLHEAHLYVLITESACHHPWKQVVEATLRGGADVLQLREKHMNDRELLRRTRWLRDACFSVGALAIINDRADVAVASNADGVHAGQDEFTVADARSVLRSDQLLGISTHSLLQASQAMADGADYIGVGPTFPGVTKSFSEFPGLGLVEEVSGKVHLPAFAIGGIDGENVQNVIQAGLSRVAVSSAIAGSENPESASRELRQLLNKGS